MCGVSLYGGIKLPDRPDPVNIQKLDLLQLPMIRDIVRYGFRIDPEHFRSLSSRLCARMAELRRDITSEIPAASLDRFIDLTDEDTDDDPDSPPPEFKVESSKQVAELLYEVLRLDQTEKVKIKKTKSGDRLSTGKKTLEQLKRAHPIVRMILEYREASKLDGTYARTMPRHAKFHPRGPDCPLCRRRHYTDELRVHTQLMTTRAVTGRICSKSPNLANIPTRSKLGQEIRAGFVASDGHTLAQRDFAQIELRLMADASGDEVMLQVYRDDGDIHLETAMRTFNLPADRIDKLLHRAPSKNTNFAVCYGITGPGLLDLMASTFSTAEQPMPDFMTEHWCDGFIQNWFGVFKGVRRHLDREEEKARRFACVWTKCGRVRCIPNVRSTHSYVQEAGVREGNNHSIQGFSADLMKLAMAELHDRLRDLSTYGIEGYPVMTIYDELIVETPEEHGETIESAMEEVMDNVLVDKSTGILQSKVPIKSDGHLMQRWIK